MAINGQYEIISDGTIDGIRVIDTPRGEDISQYITAIDTDVVDGKPIHAKVTLALGFFMIEGEVVNTLPPAEAAGTDVATSPSPPLSENDMQNLILALANARGGLGYFTQLEAEAVIQWAEGLPRDNMLLRLVLDGIMGVQPNPERAGAMMFTSLPQ